MFESAYRRLNPDQAEGSGSVASAGSGGEGAATTSVSDAGRKMSTLRRRSKHPDTSSRKSDTGSRREVLRLTPLQKTEIGQKEFDLLNLELESQTKALEVKLSNLHAVVEEIEMSIADQERFLKTQQREVRYIL